MLQYVICAGDQSMAEPPAIWSFVAVHRLVAHARSKTMRTTIGISVNFDVRGILNVGVKDFNV
jgi:hypothetical protein